VTAASGQGARSRAGAWGSRVPAVALALAVLAGVLALVLLAGGGSGGAAPRLSWAGAPLRLTPPDLPSDRVLGGRFRNEGDGALAASARDVALRDSAGRRVPGSAVFLQSFVHGRYSPARPEDVVPPADRRNTGMEVRLAPGHTAPLTVAWRERPGAPHPVRVQVGPASLPIP
jgi:hypothetical protein